MPATTMSHAIYVAALIVLIFALQFFYLNVTDNIREEVTRKQLKEVADFVSDTITNLYFLINSTNANMTIEKNLALPLDIEGETYVVELVEVNGSAQYVLAYLKQKSWIYSTSWVPPRLTIWQYKKIESGEKTFVAGCFRTNSSISIWIQER